MKRMLIATAACVLCAVSTNSIAETLETAVDQQDACVSTCVSTTLSDLQRRVEQLEAKIGGDADGSTFQPRHTKRPVQGSNLD